MIITIDGPSGTGKSTLAKFIAKKLNIKFLNSGMIYRAITFFLLKKGVLCDDENKIEKLLSEFDIKIKFLEDGQHIFIDEFDCTPFVSDKIVNENVPLFSQVLNIRKAVLFLQRDFASKNSIVIEGRDIGTEVFPNADFKFYVDCDILVRAERRYNDLIVKDKTLTLNEVVKSLENRDHLDKTRNFSPLVKPIGAIEIDTSSKTIEQTVDEMMSHINKNK